MNIEEKKADFMRSFKASRERKAEYIVQMEKLLRSDPTGVYPEMDDLSRAYYRERLSRLAKANSMEEHYLAKHLIKLCSQSDGEARHVGYYLFTKPLGKDEKAPGGALYITANVLLTLFLTLLCGFLSHSVIAAVLLLLPISELTKNLLDYVILLCVPPRRMPRLELKNGVPDDANLSFALGRRSPFVPPRRCA